MDAFKTTGRHKYATLYDNNNIVTLWALTITLFRLLSLLRMLGVEVFRQREMREASLAPPLLASRGPLE